MNPIRTTVRRAGSLFLAAAVAVVAGLAILPDTALAHCDSAQGPVVAGARKALETGEIKWALAYVQADAEPEMTAAFAHAQAVRQLGGEARTLADRYFAETTVRLHRAGEGASYTGIDETPEITPGLEAAEQSLAAGSPHEVAAVLEKAVHAGLEEYWHKVVAAGERAEKESTVKTLREKAQAELNFELFVYGVEKAAHGLAHSEEGSAAGGHTHGAAPADQDGAAERPIAIHLNGAPLATEGVAVHGEAMVPLRAVSEAAGAQVSWDGAIRMVTVTAGAQKLTVQAGNEHARANGQEITLPVAPTLHAGVLMVPAHLIADFLGLKFAWHSPENLVELTAR